MKYRLRQNAPSKDIHTCIQEILQQRGVKNIEGYMYPSKKYENDPFLLDNVRTAADRLLEHMRNKSSILIITDADTDGYCSASILWLYLKDFFPDIDLKFICHEHKAPGLEDIIDDIKNINCDKNSTNYKISLLSLYDYYKAGGKSSFLNNGETFYLGTLNKDNHNYYITSDGEVSTKTYAVRPVITIISSSILLSGKGTKDDPYKILEIKPSTLEDTTINTYVSFSNQVFKVIDNSTDATKVALNGVIKENDIDVVKSFGGKNNKYSNSKNTVGYYLNNTYLKTLDSKNIIKSNWYIGALSLDNLDYSNEKNTKVNLSVGMLSLGDMFVGDINNVLTLSRGIESDQIINVINKEGNFYGDFITSKYNVRPALYLNNELKITGGNGTFDAPYELGVSDEKGQE